MIRVVNGHHPDRSRAGDIFLTIINEQDLRGISLKSIRCMQVDRKLGFGQPQAMRPCAVVKGADPIEAFTNTCLHAVSEIGEDSRANAAPMKLPRPSHHGFVKVRPQRYIRRIQGSQLCFRQLRVPCSARNRLPIRGAAERPSVILVSRCPISLMKDLRMCSQDRAHLLPCCSVRPL